MVTVTKIILLTEMEKNNLSYHTQTHTHTHTINLQIIRTIKTGRTTVVYTMNDESVGAMVAFGRL